MADDAVSEQDKATLASIERVFFRLVSTPDEKLLGILKLLLPKLIQMLPSTMTAITKELIKVFQHLQTRINGLEAPVLPLHDLMIWYHHPSATAFSKNFVLMFCDMTFLNMSQDDQVALFPLFLTKLASQTPAQQKILLHLLQKSLPQVLSVASSRKIMIHDQESSVAQPSVDDRNVLWDYFLDVLLWQPSSSSTSCPGFSETRQSRLEPKVLKSRDVQSQTQLSILKFVAERNTVIFASVKFLMWVAGVSVAVDHAVVTFAKTRMKEELDRLNSTKKINESEYDLSSVLENQQHVEMLLAFILGISSSNFKSVFNQNRSSAVDIRTQVLLIELLCHSKTVANVFPLVLRVLCQTLLQASTKFDTTLKKSALGFLNHVFSRATLANLQGMGTVLLTQLFQLQKELVELSNEKPREEVARNCRELLYSALAILARRLPNIVTGSISTWEDSSSTSAYSSTALAEFLFEAAATEESMVFLSLQEALSSACQAYKLKGSSETKEVLEDVLFRMLKKLQNHQTSSSPRMARVIVEWSVALFPFKNTVARYICVILSSDDSDVVVRNAATAGVFMETKDREEGLPPPSLETLMQMVFSGPVPLEDLQITSLQNLFRLGLYCTTTNTPSISESTISKFIELLHFGLFQRKNESKSDIMIETGVCTCLKLLIRYPIVVGKLVKAEFENWKKFLSLRTRNLIILSTVARIVGHLTSENKFVTLLQEFSMPSSASPRVGYIMATGAMITSFLKKGGKVDPCSTAISSLIKGVEDDSKLGVEVRRFYIQALGSIFTADENSLLNSDLYESATKSILKVLKSTLKESKRLETSSKKESSDSTTLASKNHLDLESAISALGQLASTASSYEMLFEQSYTELVKVAPIQNEALQLRVGLSVSRLFEKGCSVKSTTNVSDSIIKDLLTVQLVDHSPHIRSAASTWLLVLLNDLSSTSSSVDFEFWMNAEKSILNLLNDNSGYVQECAAKSIYCIYQGASTQENCTSSQLSELVELVLHFSYKESESRNLFQELGSVVKQVNQPFMIYPFFYVSSDHSTIWHSREAIALGLGSKEIGDENNCASIDLPPFSLECNMEISSSSKEGEDPKSSGNMIETAVDKISDLQLLLPRVFRNKFDPNEPIRLAFRKLWKALVRGRGNSDNQLNEKQRQKDVMIKYFDAINTFLLRSLESRRIRDRAAACDAMTELLTRTNLPGDKIQPHLPTLWKVSLRALDDLNTNVQQNAISFVKTVGSMSVRFCKSTDDDIDDKNYSEGIIETVISFLINDGIINHSATIRGVCLGYLVTIIEQVPPTALDAHLVPLTLALLECLSSLEQAELSYAQFHTEKLSMTAEQLEAARISLARSGPIQKMLDLCIDRIILPRASVSGTRDILTELLPKLGQLSKQGIGLNTRHGVAQFVTTLIVQLPKTDVVQELWKNDLAPSCLSAINAFSAQLRREKSPSVRKSYSCAVAYLLRFATDAVVRKHIRRTCGLEPSLIEDGDVVFDQSTVVQLHPLQVKKPKTENEEINDFTKDQVLDKVSAHCLLDLCRYCKVKLEAHYDLVIPIVVLGKSEGTDDMNVKLLKNVERKSVTDLWTKLWQEIISDAGTDQGLVSSYLKEVLDVATAALGSTSWPVRKQGAVAIAQSIKSSRDNSINARVNALMKVLRSVIPGPYWDGKEAVLDAQCAVAQYKVQANNSLKSEDWKDIMQVLYVEYERSRGESNLVYYLQQTLRHIGSIAALISSISDNTELFSDLGTIWDSFFENAIADASTGNVAVAPLTIVNTIKCLGVMWPNNSNNNTAIIEFQSKRIEKVFRLLSLLLEAVWSVRVAIFQTLRKVITASSGVLNQEIISMAIEAGCGECGVGCRKYWQVRESALQLIEAIVQVPETHSYVDFEKLTVIVKRFNGDSEPKVCHMAGKIQLLLATRSS